jgi:hypothetical protein
VALSTPGVAGSAVAGMNIAAFSGVPPLSGIGGDEVRGPTSLVVPAGAAGTTAVQAAKEQPSWGVQKPPAGLGKNSSHVSAQPLQRSLGRCGIPAWLQADCCGVVGWQLVWLLCQHSLSAAASQTARFGIRVHAGLEPAD